MQMRFIVFAYLCKYKNKYFLLKYMLLTHLIFSFCPDLHFFCVSL
ncbi:hypothetical protein HMPREF1991_02968 [Hoylesella loescheii DSM 19665 = JCM 12249 = ATCC 15930]|uniref:Uncharacterized protein n=1 Tax=Hoylesella loescheii DSM 19665 = JCM 12249 = ATCC 15930 TaxID=1122985 RepID=A0A069QFW8_HOYLO|nr:hypothetical protein HMPREF1991_02968 [Hoylesella loescheii DSM 19665 = JCM 12249 = ATCC 15930]